MRTVEPVGNFIDIDPKWLAEALLVGGLLVGVQPASVEQGQVVFDLFIRAAHGEAACRDEGHGDAVKFSDYRLPFMVG